jgi:uncharacterized protein HemX
MSKQAGFAIVEGFIIVVVVLGLAGGGYAVWHRQHSKTTASTSTTASKAAYESPAVTTPSAPAVTNETGLNSALQTLNDTNVSAGSTDSSQLATQAASFQTN